MRVLWLSAFFILLDQATKFTVLQTMHRGQSIRVLGDWLRFTFTENPGMAFGITFGPPGSVTILSIIATLLIVFYLYRVRGGYRPYILSLAAILGGALGNIIDRVFYGALLYDGGLFTGRVVDFIHVNLWNGYIDLPFMAPRYLSLFPIWNVADMAIVGGVVGILLFQRRFHDQLIAAQTEAGREEGAAVADETAEQETTSEVSTVAPNPSAAADDRSAGGSSVTS